MSPESVYVRPIPVERTNPITLQILRQVYEVKRELIQQRLEQLRKGWEKSDEGVFAELCYGILLARADAAKTLPLVAELEQNRLLFEGSSEQIQEYLRQHHYALRNKSKYIIDCRSKLTDEGVLRIKSILETKFKTPSGWNIRDAREYLVSQLSGVGWKVASQFLRNVGIGLDSGLALLDTHIQSELRKFNYITRIYRQALRKARYLEYELRMQEMAKESVIPVDDLDLLIWSNKTGLIIK